MSKSTQLLRACIRRGGDTAPAESATENVRVLQETGYRFEAEQDQAIWYYVTEFVAEHGHAPVDSAIRAHFENARYLEAVDRLDQVTVDAPLYRGDFVRAVETALLQRATKSAGEWVREAARAIDCDGYEGFRSWLEVHPIPDLGGSWGPDAPEPLEDSGTPLPPPLPLDAFPPSIQRLAVEIGETLCVDYTMPLSVVLAALGAACGRGWDLQVSDTHDWSCPLGTYMAYVAPASYSKGPVHKVICGPLYAWEREQRDKFERLHEEWQCRKPKKNADSAEIFRWKAEEPLCQEVYASDATIEAFVRDAAKQGGALAYISGEASKLVNLMGGQYSDGGADTAHWCSGLSGEPIKVSRIGRDNNYLAKPAFTIGVGAQPEVIRDLGHIPRIHEHGLFARFQFVYVPRRRKTPKHPLPPVSPETKAVWRTSLQRILDAFRGSKDCERQVLRLSSEAESIVWELKNEIDPRREPGGDLERVEAWSGKIVEMIARFAGMFALYEAAERGLLRPANEPAAVPDLDLFQDEPSKPEPEHRSQLVVERRHMEMARRLWEPLLAHALHAHSETNAKPHVIRAHKILERIRKLGVESTTARELFDACRGSWCKSMEEFLPGLQLLAKHGWVRVLPLPPKRKGGRPPSPKVEVHPAAR